MVLAVAVVAVVGVLVWRSQSGDTGQKGAARKDAQIEKARERGPAPALETGGDEAEAPLVGDAGPGGALYDRLGERKAIKEIVGKLLEAATRNPVIMANEKVLAAARKVNVRELQSRFTNYICKQAGGPCKYSGRPMKEYLAQLELTPAEWDAANDVFAAVLTEMSVPEQEAEELMAIFRALADDSQ